MKTPRRRSTPLTREEIVRIALDLIDQDGLASFSMRKLGARLEVDVMAIYRHVDDQEALFDEIAAAMFRGVDVAGLPWTQPWPNLTFAYGMALRDALLRHPDALPIYARRPNRSPDAVEWGVRALLKLSDEGVPGTTALQVALCINEFVVGHAMAVSAWRTESQRSRRPEEGSAGFTVLAAAAAASPPGAHFELGLRAIIDGLRRAVTR
ncbi:TetR/AcrR family transcriptional regulator [Nucisporomicrobium flavum]|uniref:TetR/AcrR family transcriptional regulator n=1 Tax=Nucisporomicrobium flavum TaxID=2785915 RepID=UPI003C2E043A